MDTIQNAKPVMHATGGQRLYRRMGHAFVCLLGSLTVTQQLNKTSRDSAATTSLCFFSNKALMHVVCVCVGGGEINTLMHSCLRQKHAE